MELLSDDTPFQANGINDSPLRRPTSPSVGSKSGSVKRRLERSWPIADYLKNENPDELFNWIGQCIAQVVHEGSSLLNLSSTQTLPLGVTFSFPMVQDSIQQATLMGMGKGFAISSNVDLGSRLLDGYNIYKTDISPSLRVAAIANDSVSTLVSFIFKYDESANHRACMGLILGTGCNATIPLKPSLLHPSKRPSRISIQPDEALDEVRIAVNTEWSINGSAPPLRDLGWITCWDAELDASNEIPGFQPLEYMTAGRYLGELVRIILLDYIQEHNVIPADSLPSKLYQLYGLSTPFLSNFKPLEPDTLINKLRDEFLESTGGADFTWSEDLAASLYHITKAVEYRAAGIVSAAIIGLLLVAEEIDEPGAAFSGNEKQRELGVGFTGGCIVHFQDYLADCQQFLDSVMAKRFGEHVPVRILLSPCHDGGVVGAGILAAAASSSISKRT